VDIDGAMYRQLLPCFAGRGCHITAVINHRGQGGSKARGEQNAHAGPLYLRLFALLGIYVSQLAHAMTRASCNKLRSILQCYTCLYLGPRSRVLIRSEACSS
jgi:hypothetical protein